MHVIGWVKIYSAVYTDWATGVLSRVQMPPGESEFYFSKTSRSALEPNRPPIQRVPFFYVLLTMHLSIILVITKFNAQILVLLLVYYKTRICALSWFVTKIKSTGFVFRV